MISLTYKPKGDDLMKNDNISEEILHRTLQINSMDTEYILYESKFKTAGRHIYSIEIISHTLNGTESTFTYDITRRKATAKNIFNKIYRGMVTPCTLNDILEDIL